MALADAILDFAHTGSYLLQEALVGFTLHYRGLHLLGHRLVFLRAGFLSEGSRFGWFRCGPFGFARLLPFVEKLIVLLEDTPDEEWVNSQRYNDAVRVCPSPPHLQHPGGHLAFAAERGLHREILLMRLADVSTELPTIIVAPPALPADETR